MLQSSNQDLAQHFHPSKVPCNQHHSGTWPDFSSEKLKSKVVIHPAESKTKKTINKASYLLRRRHWTVHSSKLDASNFQLQRHDLPIAQSFQTQLKEKQ